MSDPPIGRGRNAGGDHRHPLAPEGGYASDRDAASPRIEHADDFVLDETQPFRAAAAVAILSSTRTSCRASRDHSAFSSAPSPRKHISPAGMFFGKRRRSQRCDRAVSKRSSLAQGPRSTTLSMIYPISDAQPLSRSIVGQQWFYAGFAALWIKAVLTVSLSTHVFSRLDLVA